MNRHSTANFDSSTAFGTARQIQTGRYTLGHEMAVSETLTNSTLKKDPQPPLSPKKQVQKLHQDVRKNMRVNKLMMSSVSNRSRITHEGRSQHLLQNSFNLQQNLTKNFGLQSRQVEIPLFSKLNTSGEEKPTYRKIINNFGLEKPKDDDNKIQSKVESDEQIKQRILNEHNASLQ